MKLKQKYMLSLKTEVHLRTRISLCSAFIVDFQIYVFSYFVFIIFNRLNSTFFTLHIFVIKRFL